MARENPYNPQVILEMVHKIDKRKKKNLCLRGSVAMW